MTNSKIISSPGVQKTFQYDEQTAQKSQSCIIPEVESQRLALLLPDVSVGGKAIKIRIY